MLANCQTTSTRRIINIDNLELKKVPSRHPGKVDFLGWQVPVTFLARWASAQQASLCQLNHKKGIKISMKLHRESKIFNRAAC